MWKDQVDEEGGISEENNGTPLYLLCILKEQMESRDCGAEMPCYDLKRISTIHQRLL